MRDLLIVVSILLGVVACTAANHAPPPASAAAVFALAETDPVISRGDAADDVAIWIHPLDARLSRIIGTDKNAGIESYGLDGSRLQSLPVGRMNNIDLRVVSGSQYWTALAAASNRSTNTISLFSIDSTGQIYWLKESEVATGLTEPYGLCMFSNDNGLQVFVNDTDGRYQQWLLEPQWLTANELPQVKAKLLREFSVPSQPEGCVADDANQKLFVGVENEGIRVLSAHHDGSADMTVIADIDNDILVADVEGLSLYLQGDDGYLVASIQGNYSYAVYERRPPYQYRGSFVIKSNPASRIDGTDETDGLDASSLLIVPGYPEGILVVQDGINTLPSRLQNFKYVSWRDIRTALAL